MYKNDIFRGKSGRFRGKNGKVQKMRGENGTRVSWVLGGILEEKLGKLAVNG